MHSRFIIVNVALMCALAFMDTGCRTKAGGWRWPWQKDTSLINDPALAENLVVPGVVDEHGNLVGGADGLGICMAGACAVAGLMS